MNGRPDFAILPAPIAPDAEPIARALLALPVFDPNRTKLRDAVRLSDKQLAQRCRKFMTRTYFDKPPAISKPMPTYADWLDTACRPRPLRAEHLEYPSVPYGLPDEAINALAMNPAYLREFHQANRLKD